MVIARFIGTYEIISNLDSSISNLDLFKRSKANLDKTILDNLAVGELGSSKLMAVL
jgi:hypothetical protein